MDHICRSLRRPFWFWLSFRSPRVKGTSPSAIAWNEQERTGRSDPGFHDGLGRYLQTPRAAAIGAGDRRPAAVSAAAAPRLNADRQPAGHFRPASQGGPEGAALSPVASRSAWPRALIYYSSRNHRRIDVTVRFPRSIAGRSDDKHRRNIHHYRRHCLRRQRLQGFASSCSSLAAPWVVGSLLTKRSAIGVGGDTEVPRIIAGQREDLRPAQQPGLPVAVVDQQSLSKAAPRARRSCAGRQGSRVAVCLGRWGPE